MSSTSRTTSAPVVEPVRTGRVRERFALASSGVWAAAQAWVLSYAVVALLAVSAVLDAPSAAGSDGGLGAGVSVATGLWLLGHGVPLAASGATVTVVPLGVTALALFTVHVAAKRSAVPTLAAWIGGTMTYAAGTVALAVALDLGSTAATADPAEIAVQVGAALLGGLVIGGGGQALGMFSAPDGPLLAGITPRLDRYLPDTARLGLRAGVVGVALLVGLGALLAGTWLVLGRGTSAEITAGLGADWLGTALLLLGQAALVPNLVVWATAWLAGPGFAVGAASAFSPAGTEAGPLPALPMLGALPGEAWSTPYAVWVPVLVVGCGAVAGWFVWRQLDPALVRVRDLVWVMAGTAVAAGVVTMLLQWLAGGSAGVDALSQVGADPLLTGALVAAEVGGGAAVVVGGAHAWARRGPGAQA
ncbi:cell division protein PerM [Isoptericola aurantiacus]|uniref:cell division protein PerM n=1 Tax=Isoptericola aurantiacus TaxID=3377839 RepID=UPI00383B6F96